MKKFLKFFGLIVLAGLIYGIAANYPKLELISGFAAKSVASGHFIDNRSLELINQNDNDLPLVRLAKNSFDDAGKWAISSVYGLKERKAIYREGLGATLIDDDFDLTLPYEVPHRVQLGIQKPYPLGTLPEKDTVFDDIDTQKLKIAIENAFDQKGEKNKRTRAVIVLYKDHLVGEKYASGFNKNSKILGWSMTKSITGTYFGILQHQHKININQPAPIAEWQKDERRKITLNNLLQMNSGLEWEENYEKICDATQMLFLSKNMSRVQLEKPLIGPPNQSWNYSSGTTNLLSGILRKQFNSHQQYLDFWYSSLLDKIGMYSALVETDMSGNFVGSSYGWATARDWGKFGLLYLHKGNWNGEQIFDENWAKYVSTPTETSNGNYGAQFWLNDGGKFPDVPREMYYCSGFQGQMVAIFPNHDLVVVRMGTSEDFDFNALLSGIVNSLKK